MEKRSIIGLVAAALLATSCGSGGSAPPVANLSGSWRVEFATEHAGGYSWSGKLTARIVASGNQLTISDDRDTRVINLSGEKATWTTTLDRGGGRVCIERGTGTFSQDAFSATVVWVDASTGATDGSGEFFGTRKSSRQMIATVLDIYSDGTVEPSPIQIVHERRP